MEASSFGYGDKKLQENMGGLQTRDNNMGTCQGHPHRFFCLRAKDKMAPTSLPHQQAAVKAYFKASNGEQFTTTSEGSCLVCALPDRLC